MGFDEIRYKGEKVVRDGFEADSYRAISFKHAYRGHFTFVRGEENPPGRHDCFGLGDWCWLNARQHPLDAMKFLKRRIKRLWRKK